MADPVQVQIYPERFSASRAERLMTCPGSANLPAAIPNWEPPPRRDKGRARQGDDIHEIFHSLAALPIADQRGFLQSLEYYMAVRETRRFKVLSEESFVAEWLKTKPRTTVDRVLYVQDELHIFDWKTGKIPVEVVDNKQLLFYAACAIHLAPKAKSVTLHIVQPWAKDVLGEPNMRSWEVSAHDLGLFMLEAQAAEDKILAGDLSLNPSDEGCKFCPANPRSRGEKASPYCPTLMQAWYPDTPIDEDFMLEDD